MASLKTYTITVNSKQYTVSVTPDTPLLWVLRDHVGLTGTKYGCGNGDCGACIVIIDDSPQFSCLLPIEQILTKKITTIEGLSNQQIHPIQQAWIDEQVSQCGYCQPGQIMMAASLFLKTPNPSDEEVINAMSKVLCRCGTYPRVEKAIKKLTNNNLLKND